MPVPAKLPRKGIIDIVRISDARMSGAAYGTVVLHVSTEAALRRAALWALVCCGDMITLDVLARSIHLHVDDATLREHRAEWTPPARPERGWPSCMWTMCFKHTEEADLDFLIGYSGASIPRRVPLTTLGDHTLSSRAVHVVPVRAGVRE